MHRDLCFLSARLSGLRVVRGVHGKGMPSSSSEECFVRSCKQEAAVRACCVAVEAAVRACCSAVEASATPSFVESKNRVINKHTPCSALLGFIKLEALVCVDRASLFGGRLCNALDAEDLALSLEGREEIRRACNASLRLYLPDRYASLHARVGLFTCMSTSRDMIPCTHYAVFQYFRIVCEDGPW